MEIFRTIKNYEGLYEVSNLGNVKSVEREFEANLRCVTKSENMRNPLTRKHTSESADRVARSERMKGERNPAKHYTEEWRKHLSEAQKGKSNFKCWKPVIITKDSEEIFCNSLTEAAKYIGTRVSDIGSVLMGRQKTTHGLKVKYANI